MNSIIFVIIIAVLFALPFILKKRFGILVLALAVGSILNEIWSYDIGLLVRGLGVPDGAVTSALVSILIILGPSLLLVFQGFSAKNSLGRFVGAIIFAIVAISFIIEPVGQVLTLNASNSSVYNWFSESRYIVIGFGLVFSIIDLIFTKKSAQLPEKKRRH